MYFYTVNLELLIWKNLYFSDKTFILQEKTFILVIKPLFQKLKPLKKTFIFENQSWRPGIVFSVELDWLPIIWLQSGLRREWLLKKVAFQEEFYCSVSVDCVHSLA